MSKTVITVRGVTYRRIAARGASACGSKFFGKATFLLRHPDGSYWTAFGKDVAHNSRLTPAEADRWPEHMPKSPPSCGCGGQSRCPEADGLWAAANAVYYSQGYDAWLEALLPYNEHLANADVEGPLTTTTPAPNNPTAERTA